jgi:Leucine Rich repeat
MESNLPLVQHTRESRTFERRAALILATIVLSLVIGLLIPNGIYAYRINRIVKSGGLIKSRSDYFGQDAASIVGYRLRGFYEDHYVIRDYYDVYLGDTDRAFEPCGAGISFADAADDGVERDFGDEGPRMVRALERVRRASFAETSVTDDGLAPLAGMKSIEFLDLSSTQVRGPGLAHLRGLPLYSLVLEGTPIDNAGLGYLPEFPDLHQLEMAKTKISTGFVQRLLAFPHLEVLDLSHTSITDDDIRELSESSLPLHTLYLNHTEITPKAIPYLEKMTTLNRVYVCETKITKQDSQKSPLAALQVWANDGQMWCKIAAGNFL